ncbi:MAG: GspE/PulE family protein [bacterium]
MFVQNKAKNLGYPYLNLVGKHIPPKPLSIIPKVIAQKHKITPYTIQGNKLWIAAVNPEDHEMTAQILQLLKPHNLDMAIAIISETSLRYALKSYDFVVVSKPMSDTAEISKGTEETIKQEIKSVANLKARLCQSSTSQVLDVLISGAIQVKASDIHIEPKENTARIRFRIDGFLHTISELPQETYKLLRSRIKFLAKLKLDLSKLPQDGQFEVTQLQKKIDVRVSSLPSVYGENLVLRLLTQENRFYSLDDLGFNDVVQQAVKEAISKPHGMILNTGPTGSGKTTTLYAILEQLNKPGVKIITLEDPVEYRLQGISQSQIDPENGYDYVAGIRSVVRQDPDIIMIGEIRDRETAKTGIQAAQTGHLVLSTLHTNNAVATIVRLTEMGVEPYLLPGSINLIIAQRLVRKICQSCREQYLPDQKIIDEIQNIWKNTPSKFRNNKSIPNKLWRGKKCERCNNTGYSGRITVAEALTPDSEIENMVINRNSVLDIQKTARRKGMVSLLEDGISKVLEGVTTIDEVWRVAKE